MAGAMVDLVCLEAFPSRRHRLAVGGEGIRQVLDKPSSVFSAGVLARRPQTTLRGEISAGLHIDFNLRLPKPPRMRSSGGKYIVNRQGNEST